MKKLLFSLILGIFLIIKLYDLFQEKFIRWILPVYLIGFVVFFCYLIYLKTKKKIVFKHLILVFIVFIIGLFLIELIYKDVFYVTGSAVENKLVSTMNENAILDGFFMNYKIIPTNLILNHNDSKKRVVFIGDSNFDEEYIDNPAPKYLRTMLDPNNESFDFLSLSFQGHGVLQNLAMFQQNALLYEPDLIIIGYTLNDPANFILRSVMKRDYLLDREYYLIERFDFPRICKSKYFLQKSYSLSESGISDLIFEQYLFVNTRHPLTPLILESGFYEGIHDDPCMWARVQTFFKEIGYYSEKENVPVILVIFPLNFQYYNWTTDYPFSYIHEQVSDEALSNGFEVIDLAHNFTKYPHNAVARRDQYPIAGDDFLHFNDFGNKIISDLIYEKIIELDIFDIE